MPGAPVFIVGLSDYTMKDLETMTRRMKRTKIAAVEVRKKPKPAQDPAKADIGRHLLPKVI